jgi:AcrR family transcriptional regulator
MAAGPQRRLPLTRDRILQAALALADESGIDSLTMRKLGQELGFEAMSLYNHVANKDDLLNGVLDLVLAEGELPSGSEDWDAAIRRSAVAVYDALRRHPWACPLVMMPTRIRPARLAFMDALLGRLRAAGFSAETTYTAYHVLDAYIVGFSLWEAGHTYSASDVADLTERFKQTITLDDYPHLAEHAEQHFAEGPHREVRTFEYGLDLILDGLKKIHEAAPGAAGDAAPGVGR